MILRRLSTAIRKQDWFTVAVETLIVVFGVFIGLQVNNWNETRQERLETQSVLERLERDFQQQFTLTQRNIDRQLSILEANGRLINGIRAGELDEQTLIADISFVDSVATIPGTSATFQELVSNGRLRFIQNTDLRDKLYSYDRYITFLQSMYGQIADPVNDLGHTLFRAKTMSASGVPSETFVQLGKVEFVDQARLLEDPEIIEDLQIAYLTQDNTHLILVNIHGRIEDILDLLAEERGSTP